MAVPNTPSTYWERSALEARVGRGVVAAICDDDGDGAADDDVIAGLQLDSCSKVNGYLTPMYGHAMPFAEPVPYEIQRLSLDVAVALVAQRHPEHYRRDWQPLMKQAETELDNLRLGKTRLDVPGPPAPAANEGGFVGSGNPDCPAPPPKVFADGTGIF